MQEPKTSKQFHRRLTHLGCLRTYNGPFARMLCKPNRNESFWSLKLVVHNVAFALRKAQHPKPLDSLRSLHKCSAYENSIYSLGYMLYRRVYYAIDLDPLTMECCANYSMRRVCMCLSSVTGILCIKLDFLAWLLLFDCAKIVIDETKIQRIRRTYKSTHSDTTQMDYVSGRVRVVMPSALL